MAGPDPERHVVESVTCSHATAKTMQPRQLSRRECENLGIPVGSVAPRWLCGSCRGIFNGKGRPEAGRKPDEIDRD